MRGKDIYIYFCIYIIQILIIIQAFDDARLGGVKPRWVEFPSNGKPPPECYTSSHIRDNHLGDIKGSDMSVYNWTLPDLTAKKCVLRIR